MQSSVSENKNAPVVSFVGGFVEHPEISQGKVPYSTDSKEVKNIIFVLCQNNLGGK